MKRSKWLALGFLGLVQLMVVLDVSVVNVALPALKSGLHFSQASLPWVITAYALTFGGFLLLGGRAADLFGRKRMLLSGLAGFIFFSLLIGLAQSAIMMITLRGLQGFVAALMAPSALSIVLNTYHESKDRSVALSVWSMVSAGGAAVGLLVGGLFTEYINWRWNFFINVPIGIAAFIAIFKVIPAHIGESRSKALDLPGAALVTSALMLLVYGITAAPRWGWFSGATLGVGALAFTLLALFIFNESRSKHPLMPLSIFKIESVAGANMMMAPVYAGMMGMFFLTSLYIQNILHYSPALTGVAFLPFPVVSTIMSLSMPKLTARYSFRPFLIIGPLLIAISLAWLSRLTINSSYIINLLPALMLMPVGVSMSIVSINLAATLGVPRGEAGLASGLITTSQQMGGALGLSILSSIATSVTAANLHLGPLAAQVYGDGKAFLGGVVLVLIATVVAITIVGRQRKSTRLRSSA